VKLCVAVDGSSCALPAKCARSVPLAPGNDAKLLVNTPKGGGPVTVGSKTGTSPDTRVNVIVAPGTPWLVQVSVKLPDIKTWGGVTKSTVERTKVNAVGHRTGPCAMFGDTIPPLCLTLSLEFAVQESEIPKVPATVAQSDC
jgi:hypothetical protein